MSYYSINGTWLEPLEWVSNIGMHMFVADDDS